MIKLSAKLPSGGKCDIEHYNGTCQIIFETFDNRTTIIDMNYKDTVEFLRLLNFAIGEKTNG